MSPGVASRRDAAPTSHRGTPSQRGGTLLPPATVGPRRSAAGRRSHQQGVASRRDAAPTGKVSHRGGTPLPPATVGPVAARRDAAPTSHRGTPSHRGGTPLPPATVGAAPRQQGVASRRDAAPTSHRGTPSQRGGTLLPPATVGPRRSAAGRCSHQPPWDPVAARRDAAPTSHRGRRIAAGRRSHQRHVGAASRRDSTLQTCAFAYPSAIGASPQTAPECRGWPA